ARRATSGLLNAVTALTWALSIVALLVAFLSVTVTMTAVGRERRAELGVLRALGLTPARSAALLVLDALTLTLAGGAVGL
ncbi:FtsX-like permease family protein, partial [Deinococcus pimensis]|uniref:FtsX-like permease family protein n=1 Tax=Deinococcus pimensis TaxID=309888 RepID=UPI0005EB440A